MEKERISPEVAYVKSKDIIDATYSSIELGREKMRFYQKVSVFASLAVGAIASIMTKNPSGFILPIIAINGSILPLTEYIKNGTFEYESNGHTFPSDT